MEVWRSLPIPVADRLYRPVRPHRRARRGCSSSAARPCTASAGCSTSSTASTACTWRSGSASRSSSACSTPTTITFNVHNEPYPTFENRVLPAPRRRPPRDQRAAEPDPRPRARPGLRRGRSFPRSSRTSPRRRAAFPDAFQRVRVRGRQKAEQYRASRVWPRAVRDLFRRPAGARDAPVGARVASRRSLSSCAGAWRVCRSHVMRSARSIRRSDAPPDRRELRPRGAAQRARRGTRSWRH